jgi:hypothetical protein
VIDGRAETLTQHGQAARLGGPLSRTAITPLAPPRPTAPAGLAAVAGRRRPLTRPKRAPLLDYLHRGT